MLCIHLVWYLTGTNFQATSMQVSLNPEPCTTYQILTNLMTGVMLQRKSNIKLKIQRNDGSLNSITYVHMWQKLPLSPL